MRSVLLASVAATALCLSGPVAFAQDHSGNMGSGAPAGASDHESGGQRNEGGAMRGGAMEHSRSAGGAEQMHRSGGASAESRNQHSGSTNGAEHNGSMRESNGGHQHTGSMREHNAGTEHNGATTESNRGSEHAGSARESDMHHGTADSHGTARGNEETRGAAREGEGSRGASAHESEARGGGHEGRSVHLSSTQRTRFVDSIRSEHISVIDHASFDVNVGVVVPATYHFYPLPEDIVTFVPEYRGYDFIVVAGDILVIDPATREIVDVIPEG